MKPNASDLVSRDLALASLLGLTVLTAGQDNFGAEATFGGQFSEFGVDGDLHDANNSNALAAVDVMHGALRNAGQLDTDANRLRGASAEEVHLRRIASIAMRREEATQRRLELLDPNRGSTEKIGRYTFSLNQQFVLGIPEAIAMTNNPLTDIKPEKMIFNAPCFGFALISVLQVGNVSVIIGGFEDAANYGPTALGVHVSMPLLTTSNRAQVAGEYSGLSPAPYTSGAEYPFTLTLQGPARMTI